MDNLQEQNRDQNKVVVNTQDLRLIRRMKQLMPLKDPIKKEKKLIDSIKEFSKVITFISPRPVLKEIAFYYLYHNNVIDFVKVFTAESIKDIYFGNHPDYKSFHAVNAPIIVILLGTEMYNKEMITILNLFSENFLSYPYAKALIFAYNGRPQEFKNKYLNVEDRGVLNTGRRVSLDKVVSKNETKEYC